MNTQIIAFAGSNSPNSINEQLTKAAIDDISIDDVTYVDFKDMNIPMYGKAVEKEQGIPTPIKNLYQQMTKAEGFIVASPEHNGLLPAFFKNIIDWLTRIDQEIFMNKPVLLLSASPGDNGGATNLSILSDLMPFWGAEIVDTYSLGKYNEYFDVESQTIVNPDEAQKFSTAIEQLEEMVMEPIAH
ncbi:NADPH-dependent FMN reductase [Fodinibius halophilus]|uniref:NAD(P)H-dependent oxidoreductase n=1 Tax=Fodinibius halophilus TaxID=1736908 RepID=A0A6M1TIZ8_9BACT|nr:NAD(P)H-dependent oxidoreductase [Fodinibius halophilus]NGP88580.1 NAD(P)H-dependent oxidoreductase [Fodinibius halophilus]